MQVTNYLLTAGFRFLWYNMNKENYQISGEYAHKYVTNNGITMVELHVDQCNSFQDTMNATTRFGGNLSVRKPNGKKPVIIFGQDECIFKQYTFSKKAWMNSEGAMPLIPKDEGAGIMISTFVSREFGHRLQLTEAELQKVNEY